MSDGNNFLIREASYRDILTLLPLYVNFYTELRSKQGWKPSSIKEYEEDVRMILKRDEVFIAYDGQMAIGFVRISRRDGAYWIEELYVEKKYRKLGVGRTLLNKAEEYIKNFEISSYIMVLPQDRDSLEFWLKNGYEMLNTIELVKDFDKTKRLIRPRIISILGYPLEIARWKHENYTREELEYLEAIDNFFKSGGSKETYLKIVAKALRQYKTT